MMPEDAWWIRLDPDGHSGRIAQFEPPPADINLADRLAQKLR
jgi:hypothetical protein